MKEYHMNLERFRGEPDNMIDSDGNIIFGNAASKRVSMTFSSDYGDKCSYKLTKEQYHQLGLICDEYDEVLEPYWKQLREIADNAGLKKELYNVAWSEVRAKVSVSYKPGKQPKSEDEIAATDTDGTVWTAVINTQNSPLTMRDAPSQSGRTICKIPKGETVKVLKKGDWAKIEYDGEQGYVNGKYLKYEE